MYAELLLTMKGFIIDTYNPRNQRDRNCAISTFYVHDVQFAIKEVELDQGGLPILEQVIGKEVPLWVYQVYDSVDAAKAFVKEVI